MNLKELHERFDAFVGAVGKRLRQDGHDPEEILEPRRSMLRLRAVTLRRNELAPLFVETDMRLALQNQTPVEEHADRFVAQWRDQKNADESV